MISIGLGYVKISIIIEFKTHYQNVLSILSSNSTSPLRKSPISEYHKSTSTLHCQAGLAISETGKKRNLCWALTWLCSCENPTKNELGQAFW